jgi:hypothetical protein
LNKTDIRIAVCSNIAAIINHQIIIVDRRAVLAGNFTAGLYLLINYVI